MTITENQTTETENITAKIAELDNQIAELDNQIRQRTADLKTIQYQIDQYNIQAEATQRQIDMYLDDLNVALARANAAINTPNEAKAASQAAAQKKLLDQARKAFDKLAKAFDKELPALQDKANELATGITTRIDQRNTLKAQRLTLTTAQKQIEDEQANEQHQQYVQAIKHKQDEIEALRSQLSAALIDLHKLKADGVETLAKHPELLTNLHELLKPEDSVTRLLDASLQYIDTILNERYNIPQTLELEELQIRGGWGNYSIWDATTVTEGEVNVARSRATNGDRQLTSRKEWITRLGEEYRQRLQQVPPAAPEPTDEDFEFEKSLKPPLDNGLDDAF